MNLAFSFFAIAFGLLICLIQIPAQPKDQDKKDLAELARTLAALNSGELENTGKKVAEDPDLRASGDTCLMRRRVQLPRTDRDFRAALGKVALTPNADAKLVQLDALLQHAEGIFAWRVALEQTRVALRTGQIGLAQKSLRQAQSIPDVPVTCRADEAYLRALSDPSRRLEHLAEAGALDPGSWTFAAAHLRALLKAPDVSISCADRISMTIRLVIQMRALASNKSQLARLQRNLHPLAHPALGDVVLGMIEETVNLKQTARTRYQTALQQGGFAQCEIGLQLFFNDRLKVLGEGDK